MIPPDNSDLMSTMKIRPEDYSLIRAQGRLHALRFAVAGVLYLIRRQRSIQVLMVYTIICLSLAMWLSVPLALTLELVLVLGTVWITEAINTAIEAAVDVATQDFHPMAKVSKDVASGAALIASFLTLIVTLMILVPPLLERLSL